MTLKAQQQKRKNIEPHQKFKMCISKDTIKKKR